MRPASATRFRLTARLAVGVTAALTSPVALADDSLITVKTVKDDAISARLVEFSLVRGLTLYTDEGGEPRHFPTPDVVHIISDQGTASRATDAVRLELIGGGLLFGRATGSEDDAVVFESPTIGKIRVPLTRILAWKTPAADEPRFRSAVTTLADRDEDAPDALLLTNGDVVRGFVAAIDETGFLVETDSAGQSRVAHDTVVAAAMVPTDVPSDGPDPSDGLRANVLTTDGQRLTASTLDWSERFVAATVFEQTALRIRSDRIARIDVIGGRWEWLTALEPISYEHTPALSLDWNWQVNRNVTGGPLRVAGVVYHDGLGVHSQCSITFDLMGAFSEFVTSMGVDDQAGPYADVDVEIRVDGQLRFTRQGVRGGVLYGPVRLDVAGAKRIKLTVLFGRNADLQDRFDWIEAALIR
ncbi:MAG TPA: NPCBM/NEW2 domain-containing protein [Phycisphaerae bacterium]|nr:NPCBM/NEW2 domain-containing protein [Phycisphaerae bacterium]